MTCAVIAAMERCGKIRYSAIVMSVLFALLCALGLRYAATVSTHTAEMYKVMNYAPDGIVVCDAAGSVVYANDAIRAITGFTEQDLTIGGVLQLIPEALQLAHKEGMANARLKSSRGIEGVNYKHVYPVRKKDGTLVICTVSVGTLNRSGGPQFFAFISPLLDRTLEVPMKAKPEKASPSHTAETMK